MPEVVPAESDACSIDFSSRDIGRRYDGICVCVCVHDFLGVCVQNVNKQDLCNEVNLANLKAKASVIGGAKFSTTLKLPIGMF